MSQRPGLGGPGLRRRRFRHIAAPALALGFLLCSVSAFAQSREEIVRKLEPYRGDWAQGVDRTTLKGKVLCGYQGWFTAPRDGSSKDWSHYARRGKFEPGHCSIDLWPDVSELTAEEKFPTPFRLADGAPAYVFSSHTRQTVLRHFRWMKDYAIDGVFVQRFAVETVPPLGLNHVNEVLSHCREGANVHGRAYAVMYDLSGLQAGQTQRVIDDWKLLVDRMQIGRDENDHAYLTHQGRPVIAVWGIGFNDDRKYTLAECQSLIRFFKHDKRYGGLTVMLGVPTGWRTLDADSVSDKKLHEIVLEADVVNPWTVGRYNSPEAAIRHAEHRWQPDIEWCIRHGKEYLPVAFPGFSWHNMRPEAPLNQIPRLKGRFLWTQYAQAKKAGAAMIYQAMFDEMDEGTAVFKCTNDPPTGESKFLTYEGLPSDHYLWLTGLGGRLLRGEIKGGDELPKR